VADLEARIQAIASDLQLQPRLRTPNPIFARRELRRLAIEMLREAGKPLTIRDMALGALKAKGVRFPNRRTMKVTRVRLREVFAKLQDRGVARTAGSGRAARRALVSSGPHSRHYVHGCVQPTEPTSGLIQIVG
jgi:hypothetical protein